MKQLSLFLFMVMFLFSCGSKSQNKAEEKAAQLQSAINPDAIATASGGYTMTAKINGKDWEASHMMPPDITGRIVGYYQKEYIGLPYKKEYLQAGKKIALGEDEAVDIFITGVGLATTKTGETEIIKVDEHSAEGKFYFTCIENESGKKIEITNGFFRIQFANR